MPRRKSSQDSIQLSLSPSPLVILPDHERFPFNHGTTTADQVIDGDLRSSVNPLLITSYTSLDRVLEFLARLEASHAADPAASHNARIVLGHEPSPTRRRDFRDQRYRFTQEIADFWLKRGISIARSAQVLMAIKSLESGIATARTSSDRVIHAKMYITQVAATLGSSNYSKSGMIVQAEANCRFVSDNDPEYYAQANQLAEAIWAEARDYQTGLIDLLKKLIQPVDWREAVGRACAELLHGVWAMKYLSHLQIGPETSLWPAQLEGIAEALWVLDNVGSVLVADATGSGKTKMGANLLLAAQIQRLRTGTGRLDPVVIICPPSVEPIWRYEAIRCNLLANRYSHGILSNRNASAREDTIEAIRRATILAVDESHHYLNRATARTQVLYRNMADHVVLFTATPINRGTRDLLSIIDLLGGDNFEDHILNTVETAWRRRNKDQPRLTSHELEGVRNALQKFTVRRTKSAFNALVDREPEQYRNALGKLCRYPKHEPRQYPCNESPRDREIALAIRDKASELVGLTHLRKALRIPLSLAADGISPEQYLSRRLGSASGLTKYLVGSALRSSRAALLEHLRGTDYAKERLRIFSKVKNESTGNVIGVLKKIAGRPPKCELGITLPAFLQDPRAHARECEREIAIYEEIERLLESLSDDREDAKTDLLVRRLAKHDRILAFDTYLITLHDLKKRLDEIGASHVLLATGETKGDRAEVQRAFALGSERTAIALCSDALSEGVNLQAASAIVLLDMPSVIRVAEQRIGRIDRMDSPHDEIEVFWPDDSPEFAIRSKELFLARVRDVADLLGSNLKLPASLEIALEPEHTLRAEDMQKIVAHYSSGDVIEGVRDAFHPVRMLVEGDDSLVPSSIYETVRNSKVRIRVALSVVEAEERWAFYAISGSDSTAPRWVYLDNNTDPLTDLDQVSLRLRERLGPKAVNRPLDQTAGEAMARDMATLQEWEELFLPRRKRRAIELMRKVLDAYRKTPTDHDLERRQVIISILKLIGKRQIKPVLNRHPFDLDALGEMTVDFGVVADWWIEQIRPVWQEHLANPRRRRPARLRDIRSALIANPLPTEKLRTFISSDLPLWVQPLGTRVFAAIVGVVEAPE